MALTTTVTTETMIQADLKRFREDMATTCRDNANAALLVYATDAVKDNAEYLEKCASIIEQIGETIKLLGALINKMKSNDPTHPEKMQVIIDVVVDKHNTTWTNDGLGAYEETKFDELIQDIKDTNKLITFMSVITNAATIVAA